MLGRLTRLMRRRRIDAVVTVGTGGDKMFWGRLAAWLAGVPVICSALHSTGLPDHVELPNRLLAPLTDAFIAVAEPHGRYLAEHEGCPAAKVRVIPNGVDVERFHPRWPKKRSAQGTRLERRTPVVGIVAALRPEKNHEIFHCAARILGQMPAARFLIVGDGPERAPAGTLARRSRVDRRRSGSWARDDVPEVLSLIDVLLLDLAHGGQSVSILEAMAGEKPVVATRVGSVPETVLDGRTGRLVPPGDVDAASKAVVDLLEQSRPRSRLGSAGREHVLEHWSINRTITGFEDMLSGIYQAKWAGRRPSDEIVPRWGKEKSEFPSMNHPIY